jgi:hypothetical protein
MHLRNASWAIAAVVLASCGGGGNGGSSSTPTTYKISAAVTGLQGAGLVLHSSTGDDLSVDADGTLAFPTAIQTGTPFAVAVTQQPASPWQTCVVANGSGEMGTSDVVVTVACTTNTFNVAGTVAGLAGSGLVLRNGTDEVAISGNAPFTFPTKVASGATFAVTVKTQPSAPTQICTVANDAGTIANADATDVAVTCATNSYSIGGNVNGLSGSGLVLNSSAGGSVAISTNGPFTFPNPAASGSHYVVTVAAQPIGQTCNVANGTGDVAGANVTTVAVTCTNSAYTVGGTVTGLTGTLVLRNNGAEDKTISSNGAFTFQAPAPHGTAYSVTVKTQPASQTCTISGGAGTATAAVTGIAVKCVSWGSTVVQRWEAPTWSWGGLWPAEPAMVQHAYFNGTTIVEEKGIGWSVVNGTLPPQREYKGFPFGSRWGAGPFSGPRYQATDTTDAAVAALTGDNLLVCAIVKPAYNPITLGTEHAIIAKGAGHGMDNVVGGGWVLMQMDHHFCFHYESTDGTTSTMTMMPTPTFFEDLDVVGGPENTSYTVSPSYVVVCGGRNGGEIRIGANSYMGSEVGVAFLPAGSTALDPGPHPLTIGGYADGNPAHVFPGRVYETAIWDLPATAENIQAKLSAVQGLMLGDGSAAVYWRNREAGFMGVDGRYHTAWRNSPRIDPAKGMLFGLQGWNRLMERYDSADPNQVSHFKPLGHQFDLWTPSGGATVATTAGATAVPPGDSENASARRITLPAGAALTTPLAKGTTLGFDAPGQIHGQLWLRVAAPTTGTLRLTTSAPEPGGSDYFDIDLAQLAANTWTRVALRRAPGGPGNELTTDGTAGTISLKNTGTSSVQFWAWGLVLTQIGGGVDLASFDPGPEMLDGAYNATAFLAPAYSDMDWTQLIDALQLPMLPNIEDNGYCISVDAQPPPGLSWAAPFARRRPLLSWVPAFFPAPPSASISVEPGGGQVCFAVTGTTASPCFSPAALGWAPGSRHNIKGCVAGDGTTRLYADGVEVGTPSPGATLIELVTGRLLVGGDLEGITTAPWNGYISSALACSDGATPSECR